MKINFTKQEIEQIEKIIEEYRSVSSDIYLYQKEAEEIKEKLSSLEKELNAIKKKEDELMSELHSKYGNFGIQDVYDTLN